MIHPTLSRLGGLLGLFLLASSASAVVPSDPAKRVRLVDRLMASGGYVRHQADELDVMLMNGNRGSLRDYLTKAVAENRQSESRGSSTRNDRRTAPAVGIGSSPHALARERGVDHRTHPRRAVVVDRATRARREP